MQVNSNLFQNESWRQNGRIWFTLARLFWIIMTLVLLTIFIAGIKPRYNELATLCYEETCLPIILTPPDAAALADMGYTLHQYALFHVGLEIVLNSFIVLLACLIFWRKSDDWMGLLSSFALILFGLNFMVETDSALVALYPAWQPAFDTLTSLAGVAFVVLFFVFPDGSFVPRWTRWLIILLIITAFLDPVFRLFNLLIPSGQFSLVFLWLFLISLVIGGYAQSYRYRRVSTPAQRQQSKWVIFGFSGFIVGILGWSIFLEIAPLPPGQARVLFNILFFIVVSPAFIFFPASMVISMMRYRLWDVDLLIRRTLAYGILTGLLLLVYFGVIILVRALFGNLTGANSPFAIVISTLIIAALFNPLRTRIHEFIDRRFYRQKYDAQLVLAQFAQTARDEVEIDQLTAVLVQVVTETMQPENISLWLKPNYKYEVKDYAYTGN